MNSCDLNYYYLKEDEDSLPIFTCSLNSLSKWHGTTTHGNKWITRRISDPDLDFLLSNLGKIAIHPLTGYNSTIRLYSVDLGLFYDDLEELKKDLLIKQLSGF